MGLKALRKWIIIPVEIKVRDFDSRLLLAHEAFKNGFNIIIGCQSQIFEHINRLPAGIYFDKSIAKNKVQFFKDIIKRSFKITSLDEEGLSSSNNQEKYLTQRVCEESLSLVEKIFTWGDTERNIIKKRYPSYKTKCYPSGNPRIDLLKNNFRPIYQDKIDYIKNSHGDYILFNSSFSVNHKLGKDKLFNLWKNLGRIERQKDKKFYENKFEFFEKTFLKFSDLVKIVAESFPKKKIIVRPHPAENQSFWNSLAKNYSNILIEHEGNVYPWIFAADLVIHSSCTTGIEAQIAQVPVISYIPYTDNEYVKHISNEVNFCCYNVDDVLVKVRKILKNSKLSKPDLTKTNLHNHILNAGDEFSYKLIVDELKKINIQPHHFKEFKISIINRMLRLFKIYFNMMIGRKNVNYKHSKFKKTSIKEIKNYINIISKINGNINPKVQLIDSKLFCLQSKD